MNYAQLALSIFASFLFIFCFDFVFHGILLKPQYEAMAFLWRPAADMVKFIPLAVSIQLCFALMMAFIFASFTRETGLKAGFRFGSLMGIMLAAMQLGMYTYLPIPAELAAAWSVGFFIDALGAGIIIGLIYRRKPTQ